MRSTFYGLEIAKTGLFTAQNQLDVTSHNMSNSSTIGYTRQRVSTAALPPSVGTKFIAEDMRATSGRGAETICIDQVRNPFLDYQYRKENSTASRLSTKEQYFGYVEALFNNELDKMDVSSGLTNTFEGFYNSLHALVEAPADPEMRANVKQNAIKLTEAMNYYHTRLMEQQDTLNESVRITVDDINEISRQIAMLNEQIYNFELNGAKANDLRDQRNLLLDDLSSIIKIETYENTNGQLIVQTDGRTFISHANYTKMAVSNDMPNPVGPDEPDLYKGYWTDFNGNITTEVNITDGALKGFMDIRDGDASENVGIPYIIQQLNAVCQKVVEQFNEVHRKGYTIPSGNGDTQTNIDFFDPTCITAKDMKLSDAIMRDVNNIAASDQPVSVDGEENEQKGNGKIALELCGLINKTDADGKPDNLNSKYKELLSTISLEQDNIKSANSSQTVMLAHVEQQRRSISDVSMDEELTNMVRFGHSYNAASRMITAMDEALEILINKMGLVGRS
jgi:flagellar hook-associated protein 1 FlgK